MLWEERDPKRAPRANGSRVIHLFVGRVEAAIANADRWSDAQRTGKACIICGRVFERDAEKEDVPMKDVPAEYAVRTRPGDALCRCEDHPGCIKRLYRRQAP